MLQEAELVAVREGRLTFDAFARNTRNEWRAMAASLHRRWKLGAWIDRQDVEQNLLLAAWLFIPKWDPTRGVSLATFVRWNAIDKAKKIIHRERGAILHGNADSNPSRVERAVDLSLVDQDDEEGRTAKRFAAALAVDADQEQNVHKVERIEHAYNACRGSRERAAFVAVLAAEGDAVEAAMLIFNDPDQRLDCRMNSEEHAVEVVRDSMRAVLKRVNKQAN